MKKPKENLHTLLKRLSLYNLNPNDYVVYGSAPLVVSGYLDDVNDLDVVILPESWPFGKSGYYDDGQIEFFMEWKPGDGSMQPAKDLINNHRMDFPYEGHYFVKPEKVIEYKRNLMRPKDELTWKRYYS